MGLLIISTLDFPIFSRAFKILFAANSLIIGTTDGVSVGVGVLVVVEVGVTVGVSVGVLVGVRVLVGVGVGINKPVLVGVLVGICVTSSSLDEVIEFNSCVWDSVNSFFFQHHLYHISPLLQVLQMVRVQIHQILPPYSPLEKYFLQVLW